MIYGSVCSGIEAASCAWEPLGWKAAFLSEIEKFPRAVLEHHYPEIPLHGDFTTIGEKDYGSINLLVGGTPCQSFSVAGLRKGMDDDRGNLALEYLKLAKRKRPKWLVWENVPGVLSSNGGRDFGAFLGGLGELGYGFAYRVLDAQYFGVPQRRRRVFVIGYSGDRRPAAAVLFERYSLQGNPAPRRESRKEVAGTLSSRTTGGGGLGTDFECAGGLQVTAALDASYGRLQGCSGQDANHGHSHLVTCVHGTQDPLVSNQAFPLGRNNGQENVLAFAENSRAELRLEGGDGRVAGTLSTGGGKPGQGTPMVASSSVVRRLTPTECERLQGFPDNYTRIPWRSKAIEACPDGPRYKALGNSMAVPVMRWIGKRIDMVDKLL